MKTWYLEYFQFISLFLQSKVEYTIRNFVLEGGGHPAGRMSLKMLRSALSTFFLGLGESEAHKWDMKRYIKKNHYADYLLLFPHEPKSF